MGLLESIKEQIKAHFPELQAKELQEYLVQAEENKKELARLQEVIKHQAEAIDGYIRQVATYINVEGRERMLVLQEKYIQERQIDLTHMEEIQKLKVAEAEEKVQLVKELWFAAFKNPTLKTSVMRNTNENRGGSTDAHGRHIPGAYNSTNSNETTVKEVE